MNPNLVRKLQAAEARLLELQSQLASPSANENGGGGGGMGGSGLHREHGRLLPLVEKWRALRAMDEKLAELESMCADPELGELAREEKAAVAEQRDAAAAELRRAMSPSAAADSRNCFLEIRAATGGNESCLFAAELFRMYSRWAESHGRAVEHLSSTAGELGGWKEIISRVCGDGAYGRLKFESGAHRVQRVPETESQGRVHTSVVTVAVLPEAGAEDEADLRPQDLKVETFRASGAGGQHVNTTDSAVRVTHLPSGVSAECQDDRSQHKNRERAFAVLRARVAETRRRARLEKEAGERRRLVGRGERSDKIRTYNYPQNRVTDHRIGLTLHKLPAIMEGGLDEVIAALARADAESDDGDGE